MAFQTGTPVDPRLMQADYSGFARAAEIKAQTLANLGATIGGAIQMHQQKKAQKAMDQQADSFLLNAAQQETGIGQSLRDLGIIDAETASVARQSLGGSANVLKMASEFMQEPAGAAEPVTGSEMKNTLDLLGVESAADIRLENGDIILDPPGYFNTETLKPDDPRYRILKETKGGQALLQGLDRFAGFSIEE